jgi:hypothetical protein
MSLVSAGHSAADEGDASLSTTRPVISEEVGLLHEICPIDAKAYESTFHEGCDARAPFFAPPRRNNPTTLPPAG